MGIRTKYRRKIIFGGRCFAWYIKEDDDLPNLVLHVLSEDKQFIVQYQLAQAPENLYITVLGKEFYGAMGTGGVWRRFRCPRWDNENGMVTPGTVRKLLEWCLTESDDIVEVDYLGFPVPLGGHCPSCGVDLRGMVAFNSNACHQCGYCYG
jgi:hypothetical protein